MRQEVTAIKPNARRSTDRILGRLFLANTALPLAFVLVIVAALFGRTCPILSVTSITDLLGGQIWQPLQGQFGLYPFIVGTLWVTVVAMLLAIPVCLLTAIYLTEYAHRAVRAFTKPIMDILAGIPSVVFGVWGMISIVPLVEDTISPGLSPLKGIFPFLGTTNPTGFSILAGGIVLAVMVAPVIISVTYEVMRAVPDGLREASLAVGATRWQTIKAAVLPTSAPGVLAAVVLGFSRAFGETMAVLMVVGNVPQVPNSIFDPAYPLTALLANNYGEMMTIPLYESALMAASLVLLIVILIFNLLSALFLNRVLTRKST